MSDQPIDPFTNQPIHPVTQGSFYNYPIPFTDFGGSGQALHFSIANGYPPAAYAPLFEHLIPHYRVIALRSRPLQPGADPAGLHSWSQLADELVAFLTHASQDEFDLSLAGAGPYVGVGHSLGAAITITAALQRPELFRAVVAIEPVLFNPLKLTAYDILRRLGLAERVHPFVRAARRRRRFFASTDEMYRRYRQAPVFSRLDDRALRAYVDAAARPRADREPGVELAITPEWEAQIYAAGPLNLWGQLGRLSVPLLVIRAAESDAFDLGAVKALRSRLPNATVVDMPGTGHLAPLEKPAEVAQLMLAFLR